MTQSNSNSNFDDTHRPSPIESKRKKISSECKICGDRATFSCYGIVTCPSCKVFFKRNAENKQKDLKCHHNGHCEININTRHLCAYCRLVKCFSVGMQVELFRASVPKKVKNIAGEIVPSNRLQQISTLSLLQSDKSTLSVDQWNLLSNLIHCYDEHSNFQQINQYLTQQNSLPIKMQYKTASLKEFVIYLLGGFQALFEKNADFHSLCDHDRSLLLQNTMKQISGLGGSFTAHKLEISDHSVLRKKCELMFGTDSLRDGLRAVKLLDCDFLIFKLILGLMMFTSFDYIYYDASKNPTQFKDVKTILSIQNSYIELIWQYLLYRCGHRQAVLHFLNLIRSFFALNDGIAASIELQEYNNVVDSLVQLTETNLGRFE